MQGFKIAHFRKDNPGRSFPWFRALNSDETRALREALAERAGLNAGVDLLSLTTRLQEMALEVRHVDAEAEDFDLAATLRQLDVRPAPEVYINWHRYDEIDCMRLEDLAKNFSDVWYPSADDIEVFDHSLQWILSINHEGLVAHVGLRGIG